MRNLSLTFLARVVLVVLLFEAGQASDVRLEALEIGHSNDQTNKTAEYSDPLTINGNTIYHAQQITFYGNAIPNPGFGCPPGCYVNYLNRTDYVHTPGIGAHKFFEQQVTWNKARDICMRDGAQLVVINSNAEEALLRGWKSKNSIEGVWIGVHDMFEEDWWVTTTGERLAAMTYSPWAENRPDNAESKEHCGVLWDNPAEGIDDCPCQWKYSFVCEINLCEDAEVVADNVQGTLIANGTGQQTVHGPELGVVQPAKGAEGNGPN